MAILQELEVVFAWPSSRCPPTVVGPSNVDPGAPYSSHQARLGNNRLSEFAGGVLNLELPNFNPGCCIA
jgi:hypothetical protein